MYWIWTHEPDIEQAAMIKTVPGFIEKQDIRFDRGEKVKIDMKEPINLILKKHDLGIFTDNLISPGVRGLLFSDKLKKVLTELGVNNIDYFPLKIENPIDKNIYENYQIANVLSCHSCLNLEKSELSFDPDFPEQIEFIDSLVIDESKIPEELLLFRLKEYKVLLVVHEKVKEACNNAGITGINFLKPEDFFI